MSAHTPGPWKISSTGRYNACVSGDEWHKLAKVVIRMKGHLREEPDGVANARLIAAAPEMLEALRAISSAYSDDAGTSDLYDEQPVTITLGDVRRARAAIAKATQP